MAENIFIDTSIFVQENFLEGDRIQTLLGLGEKGHVNLLMPEITINEVKNQFGKRAQTAFDAHNELINDKQRLNIRVLRNNSAGVNIIKRLPNIKKIKAEFNETFDEAINKAKVKQLPYPTIDTGAVFRKYFNGEAPFGNGKKKEEFPDAFAIEQIEQWATEKKRTVIVLTTDNDFDGIAGKYITVVKDFDGFLNDQIKRVTEEMRLDKLNELYLLNSDRIDKYITIWVEEEFDDDSVFDDVTNWMEIHNKTIEYVKVLSKEYELISTDADYLTIEVNATISYKVALDIDDEQTGIYDSEDKVMLFREEITLEVEQHDLEISLKIRFNIIDQEDYDPDYEVLEINGDLDIKIEPDGYNDYY